MKFCLQATFALLSLSSAFADDRPNILYIALEDITPMMGCYGDEYAKTPVFDQLAAEGIRYTNAHSVAPVCSVSRSSIVTGMYPSTIGTLHHRSGGLPAPTFLKFVPNLMGEAGYYTTNQKGDYNIVGMKYDRQGKKVGDTPWRSRPNKGQPFFSKIDFNECHSSVTKIAENVIVQTRLNRLQSGDFHDPAAAPLPSFHPDDPIFRRSWARYYDAVTQVDYRTGEVLDALKEDGLWDDTIIIVWADHGVGMPRGKHTIWEQGTHVPLIVRFPKKYQHLAPAQPGSVVDDLICLMDMAPSVLSLAGLTPPSYMQGRPLLIQGTAEEREFLVAMRNRLDTRTQFVRSIRDKRFRYMRHFYPHRPYAPYETFLWEAPIYYRFQELALAGKLRGPQVEYARRFKDIEQLYDSKTDPEMIHNLADDPAYADVLKQMRQRLRDWMIETRDLGLINERLLYECANGRSLREVGQDIENYEEILDTANLQLLGEAGMADLKTRTKNEDESVRYWATLGLAVITQTAGSEIVKAILPTLRESLSDPSLDVRLIAAEGLFNLGYYQEALPVVLAEISHPNTDVQVRVGNLLDSQPPDANQALASAIEPLAIARKKFKPRSRYGSANKPLDRAYRAITGQQLYYRWGMGASGSPNSPLMKVQESPFKISGSRMLKTKTNKASKPESDSDRPNFLIIVVDDMGYGDLSKYQHSAHDAHTPNLDALASRGTLYTQAYVSAAVCSPSRAGWITGRHQVRWDPKSGFNCGLPKGIPTLASILRENGYKTAKIGKNDFGNKTLHRQDVYAYPLNHGYDEFLGFSAHGFDYFLLSKDIQNRTPDPKGHSAALGPLMRNRGYEEFKPEGDHYPYLTEVFTEEAIDFLHENKNDPFLLTLSYNSVHHLIHQVPPRYIKKYKGLQPIPHYDPDKDGKYAQWFKQFITIGDKISAKQMRDYYLANLDCLDENIGVLMDALYELKLADNTMVVFFSDNGGAPTNGATNLPLAGSKFTLWEGGIRVPFILSRPGDPHGGQVSDQVISSLDIVPTCLDAAGIRLPADLDGKPIVKSEEPRNLFWRFGETNSHAVRSGDWKLLHNGGRKNRQPTEGIVNRENLLKGTRLFNLKNDPGESKDLSKDRPKVLKRLQELYAQWSSEIASQSLNLEK